MIKKVYALGFFDGVHLGHRALLSACRELAQSVGAMAAAVTFDTHPQSLISGTAPQMINTASDRLMLMQQQGIQSVHTLHFDEKTMAMPWQDFLEYLLGELDAAGLVCGDDFRFGYGGEGNARRLQDACQEARIPCVVVPEQTLDGIRISSTHIRGLIAQGDMEQAVRFLGHPHILSGQVVTGRKLGRTIGVPTANLLLPEGLTVPKFGVYACIARIGERQYPAVTNVGTRPTVGGHRITVEPWILDFQGDLYGKTITLEFYSFLRPEKKFASLPQLQEEIIKNAQETRNFFEKK